MKRLDQRALVAQDVIDRFASSQFNSDYATYFGLKADDVKKLPWGLKKKHLEKPIVTGKLR